MNKKKETIADIKKSFRGKIVCKTIDGSMGRGNTFINLNEDTDNPECKVAKCCKDYRYGSRNKFIVQEEKHFGYQEANDKFVTSRLLTVYFPNERYSKYNNCFLYWDKESSSVNSHEHANNVPTTIYEQQQEWLLNREESLFKEFMKYAKIKYHTEQLRHSCYWNNMPIIPMIEKFNNWDLPENRSQ